MDKGIHTEQTFEEAIVSSLLVHFAVDTDECFMTTRLGGNNTCIYRLGYQNGAGNPLNKEGYRTSYLWEYVWNNT